MSCEHGAAPGNGLGPAFLDPNARGRELPPTSRFAGDSGQGDPALEAAVETADLSQIVRALPGSRLLVPVLASPEADHEGSAGIVALAAPDGRTALPVFTSVTALRTWQRTARPMPTESERAAAAARGEGWQILVINPGTANLVVPRPAVYALALGQEWRPAVQEGKVAPRVEAVVGQILQTVPQVRRTAVLPGQRAEVRVQLFLEQGLTKVQLDDVVAQVSQVLAGHEEFIQLVDSVELGLSAA